MDGDSGKKLKACTALFCLLIFAVFFKVGGQWVENVDFESTLKKAYAGHERSQIQLARMGNLPVYWYGIAAKNGNITAQEALCWDYKIGCK